MDTLTRETGQTVSEAKVVWILDNKGGYYPLCLSQPGLLSVGRAKECAAKRRVAMAEVKRMRKEGEDKMVWLLRNNLHLPHSQTGSWQQI